MKKIIKLFVFLMLLISFPKSILAASSPIIDQNYIIKTKNINLSEIGVSPTTTIKSIPLYEAYDSNNSLYFHIYSLNSNEKVNSSTSLSCKSKIEIDDTKQELLNKILSNVNQINKTNSEDITVLTNKTELLNVVATQIIVWEIMDGNRTSFEKVENSNSTYYNELVSINRSNTLSSGLSSLYEIYSKIIKNVYEKSSEKSTNSESNPYKLYYNVTNDRYQNIITSVDYNTLTNTYEIENKTNIKLSKSSSGLLAYVKNNQFFTDVKSISLNQKKGSTNTDLQNFYYFTTNNLNFVLASKADVVPTKMYFTCAQGNFKITNLEGSGGTILGSTYNIKDSNGNLLKFVNEEKNIFTYDSDGLKGSTDIVYANANSYTLNSLPDGEYSIIQTKVSEGNSFLEKEEDRTVKIKIDNGSFYTYNKILKKYESNIMRIVKFTNYTPKLYIIDSETTDDTIYTITNSSGENVGLYRDNDKKIWKAYTNISTSQSFNEISLESNKRATILGLSTGTYTITKTTDSSTETRKFKIDNTKSIGESILISFDNKKNEINFYKLDQKGNYLTGGLFSIRIVDENSENTENYVDVALKQNSDSNSYSIDENGDIYTFEVNNGKVNIKNAAAGKTYRIVELTPPEGYEIFDTNLSYVDVTFDENGYSMSTPYIINKEIMVNSDASSSAELILSIRTGLKIIKYGLIPIGIILILVLLLIIRKKIIKK